LSFDYVTDFFVKRAIANIHQAGENFNSRKIIEETDETFQSEQHKDT